MPINPACTLALRLQPGGQRTRVAMSGTSSFAPSQSTFMTCRMMRGSVSLSWPWFGCSGVALISSTHSFLHFSESSSFSGGAGFHRTARESELTSVCAFGSSPAHASSSGAYISAEVSSSFSIVFTQSIAFSSSGLLRSYRVQEDSRRNSPDNWQ